METDWKTEFGEGYDIPASIRALIAAGKLTDVSWSNDACPRFIEGRECPGGPMTLWVEHPDPSEREFSNSKRFFVTDGDEAILLETDSLDECLAYLIQAL